MNRNTINSKKQLLRLRGLGFRKSKSGKLRRLLRKRRDYVFNKKLQLKQKGLGYRKRQPQLRPKRNDKRRQRLRLRE